MASFLSGLRRNQLLIMVPVVEKREDALKFGILGAAKIAPTALINPAKSNPDVIIHAVAARDKTRAAAFARKHGIPHVRDSYDALLDDPDIDAVYNPLPNGLHFEWTMKALARGKHVLVEKPSTSNAAEAEALFRSPLLRAGDARAGAGGPVVMEAFHSRFAPAFQLFRSLLDPPRVAHARARAVLPAVLSGGDGDIRFSYDLAGGACMDLGTYPLAAVRAAFAAEPAACVRADLRRLPAAPAGGRCDDRFRATLRFPNGGTGEVEGGLRGPNTSLSLPTVTVTHRPVLVTTAAEDGEQHGGVRAAEGTEVRRTRTVTFVNFMLSPHYHRIDVVDEYVVTRKGSSETLKRYTKTETKKAYTWKEMGRDLPGEPWQSTYGHMLEQFVNKIRGREGSGVFITHDDSIAQMRALDMIYEKSGLGLRPTSKYLSEVA